MAQDREGPAGEFRNVLTLAMKTIAGEPELSVSFGAETPALQGKKVKLPQVSIELNPQEVAITRGISDSFAMRLANHDDHVHNRYRPEGKNARAMFEAVEQARVESIGSRAMPGMAREPMLSTRACSTASNIARAFLPSGR
jgi:cobaltochelatase CobT